ncbi:hypothetical protein J437_LFUL008473 [Ladona fulva]|uniref:MADF domain-containing protein n=1 Tax=Ladona fulva TaxID=123851 RepID=A0A8K0K3U8_LADFU|nr:hypothetical protein J437_LFUL008473 [Ladona fulva]
MYRDRECLWNINSPLYKDRKARYAAMKEISTELNIEGFGPRETAQKIKNLRTAYNQEIKKIAFSKRSGATGGDIYKPKVLWFETADAILRKHTEIQPTTLNLKKEPNKTIYDNPEKSEDDPTNFLELEITPKSRKTLPRKRCAEKVHQINESIREVEEITEKAKKKDNLDEYDFFGCYIASALKALPTENAITAQTSIMHVLAEEKRKATAAKSNGEF